jgi:transcriptional regulator with XRE-family HTH domain
MSTNKLFGTPKEPYLLSEGDIVPGWRLTSFSKEAARKIRNTLENMGIILSHIAISNPMLTRDVVGSALHKRDNKPLLNPKFMSLLGYLENKGVITIPEGQIPETLLEMSIEPIEPYRLSDGDIVPGWRLTSFSKEAARKIRNTLENMGIILSHIAISNPMQTRDVVGMALHKRDNKPLLNKTFMILLRSLENKGVIQLPKGQTPETLLEMSIEPYPLSKDDIVFNRNNNVSLLRADPTKILRFLTQNGLSHRIISERCDIKSTDIYKIFSERGFCSRERFKACLRAFLENGVITLPEGETLENLLSTDQEPPHTLTKDDIDFKENKVFLLKQGFNGIKNVIAKRGLSNQTIAQNLPISEGTLYRALGGEKLTKKTLKKILQGFIEEGVIAPLPKGQTLETLLEIPIEPLEIPIEPYPLSDGDIVFKGNKGLSLSIEAGQEIKSRIRQKKGLNQTIIGASCDLSNGRISHALLGNNFRKPIFAKILVALMEHEVIQLPKGQTLETLLEILIGPLEIPIKPYPLSDEHIVFKKGNKVSFSRTAGQKIQSRIKQKGLTQTIIGQSCDLSQGRISHALLGNNFRKPIFAKILVALMEHEVIQLPKGQTLETLLEIPIEPLEIPIEPYPLSDGDIVFKKGNKVSFSKTAGQEIQSRIKQNGLTQTIIGQSCDLMQDNISWALSGKNIQKQALAKILMALMEHGVIQLPKSQTIVFKGNKVSFSRTAGQEIKSHIRQKKGLNQTIIGQSCDLSNGRISHALLGNNFRKPIFAKILVALMQHGVIQLPKGQTLEQPVHPKSKTPLSNTLTYNSISTAQNCAVAAGGGEIPIEPYPLSKDDIVFNRNNEVSFSRTAGQAIQSRITQKQELTQEIIGQSCDLSQPSISHALLGNNLQKQALANIIMALMEHGVIQLKVQDLGKLLFPEAESSYTPTPETLNTAQNCVAVGGGGDSGITTLLTTLPPAHIDHDGGR